MAQVSPRPPLAEGVIEQIKGFIGRAPARSRPKLPPERALAKQLKVSRTTLREAVRALEFMGVLDTRHGARTRVARSSERILKTPFQFMLMLDRPSPWELLDARQLVEVFLAGQAAERRTVEDLRILQGTLKDMHDALVHPRAMAAREARFHEAVAAAAHYRVLERVLGCLREGFGTVIDTAPSGSVSLDVQERYQLHEDILAAIRDRHPGEARRTMTKHMEKIAAQLRRADALERRMRRQEATS